MDARVLLGGLSVGLAFASAALLASGVRSVVPRRRDAADMARGADAPRAGRLAGRLRNGFAVASPIAERLLASARVRRFPTLTRRKKSIIHGKYPILGL